MSSTRIVVFDSKPYVESLLRERNQDGLALEFIEARLSPATARLASGASIICAFVSDDLGAEVVRDLASVGVELIALRSAGHNNVDLAACAAAGITVVHVPAYSPHAVSEHTVALMLTLNRRIHRAHNRVREGNFSLDGLLGFDMYDKTAGVIGTGRIGALVIRILTGFGCRILAYDRFPNPKLGLEYVSLDDLYARSDIISLHAPLVPETFHLINAASIARMKRGVMLVNTSRGALIDTRALVEGLKSGQVGSAGLDVYEEETGYFFEDFSDRVLTDDVLARLMTFNNVLITSHQGFFTREALIDIADTTFQNIREWTSGRRGDQLSYRIG